MSTRIRPFPPDEVTYTDGGQPETDPLDVGLRRQDRDAIWQSVVACYRTGLYPALALCVRREGRVVVDRAIGHRRGNSPEDPRSATLEPATPATLFNVFSASKMVTAMLIHLLDDRGLVHLDDAVEYYIPEFGRHGKQWITLRHVLTHRAGIPSMPAPHDDVSLLVDAERTLALLCEARPVARPGRRLAYHALTGGYLLGEVIRRVTGKDIRDVLRDEILRPLGIQHFNYGVPEAQIPLVARNAFTGPPAFPPSSTLFRRSLGLDFEAAVTMSNELPFLTGVVPSGNIIGTANEASLFMELLLRGGELFGKRIFEARTVRRATSEQSYLEVDFTMALPVRYGMGFMLGTERLSPYGSGTSRAFGHIGFTNVVMWADPERDVSVCLMSSGKPFLAPGVLRWYQVMQTIADRCPRKRA